MQTWRKGHTYTNPRPDQYDTHVLSHITRAVTATDSCFALIGSHHAACQSCWVNEQGRGEPAWKTPYCRGVWKAVYQAPVPQNTCGSCWLGTAQQFYLDMRGEGGSRVTSKSKGLTYTKPRPGHYLTRAHSHITRLVAAMDTCGTRGKPVYFFFCFEAGIHGRVQCQVIHLTTKNTDTALYDTILYITG